MSDVMWRELGSLDADAGDWGGDVQVGRSIARRFVHVSLPGRLVTVTAYPVEAENFTGGYDGAEKVIALEWQTEMVVCRDVEDPGSTEVWSDVEYSDLPERFDRVYPSVEAAERAARALVESLVSDRDIGWDGAPGMSLDRHRDTLHAHSSLRDDPVRDVRAVVQRNSERGAQLDWGHRSVDGLDGRRWLVAWVFDAQDMVNPTPDDPWSGPPPGGEVVVCWWAEDRTHGCLDCEGYGVVPVHGSSDEVLYHMPCPGCRAPREEG